MKTSLVILLHRHVGMNVHNAQKHHFNNITVLVY